MDLLQIFSRDCPFWQSLLADKVTFFPVLFFEKTIQIFCFFLVSKFCLNKLISRLHLLKLIPWEYWFWVTEVFNRSFWYLLFFLWRWGVGGGGHLFSPRTYKDVPLFSKKIKVYWRICILKEVSETSVDMDAAPPADTYLIKVSKSFWCLCR